MLVILNKYIIKRFIAPFIAASLIALFVLVMQNLWLYLDDIMGKGVEFVIILEMLFYMSMSFIPLAIPVGVLISAVLNFGTLGENYELASMKSSGISLFKIMQPLIAFSVLIACFSFFISNNVIPYSNLKFKTRLSDIARQKPALNLEEKIFNYDFSGYAIRIDSKDTETGELYDVLVYDHSNVRTGKIIILKAEKGRMYSSQNESFLIMELENGMQYVETAGRTSNQQYPVSRTNFKKLTKVFDLSEFDLEQSEEDKYKTHEQMLNVTQLSTAIDSFEKQLDEIREENNYLISLASEKKLLSDYNSERKNIENKRLIDRKHEYSVRIDLIKRSQPIDSLLDNSDLAFYESFSLEDQKKYMENVDNILQFNINTAHSNKQRHRLFVEKRNRHLYELHFKFMLASSCILFLFIGAPMGAIVRKGGFGYPMLIAIIFFIIFILLYDMLDNMVKKDVIDPVLAAWTPDLVLFPIGFFLTIKAANDSKIVDVTFVREFARKMIKWWKK